MLEAQVKAHIIGVLDTLAKLAQRFGMIDIAAEIRASKDRVYHMGVATIISAPVNIHRRATEETTTTGPDRGEWRHEAVEAMKLKR